MFEPGSKSDIALRLVATIVVIVCSIYLYNRRHTWYSDLKNDIATTFCSTSAPTTSGTLYPGSSTSPYFPSPSFTPSPGATSFDNNIDFKGEFAYTKYLNGSTYLVWNYNNADKTVAKLNDHDFYTNIASNDLSSIFQAYYDETTKKYIANIYHNGNTNKPFLSFSTTKSIINPIFSFAGTEIAYVLEESTKTNNNELWTIDYKGSQMVLVLDSDKVKSLLDENDIAIDAKRFREISPLAWSHDGNRIYLNVNVQGTFEALVYLDLSTDKIEKTGLSGDNVNSLFISPDGEKIAYFLSNGTVSGTEGAVSNYTLNTFNLSTNKTTQLVKNIDVSPTQMTWSNSGDKIAYIEFKDNKDNITYVDVNSKEVKYVIKDLDASPNIISWTKNNKIIYSQYASNDTPTQTLNIINLDGTNKKELDSSWEMIEGIGFVEK